MKTRTKVVIAAIAGVISLGAIVNTLTNRYSPRFQQTDKTQSQYSLSDKLGSMSDAMIDLCTNPSIDTAYTANQTSKEALVRLWADRRMPYDDRLLLIETYVQDANTILSGLKFVKGHNEYIQYYTKSIEFQIKVARAMADPKNEFDEARYWLWAWQDYSISHRGELMKVWEQKYSPESQNKKAEREQMSAPSIN